MIELTKDEGHILMGLITTSGPGVRFADGVLETLDKNTTNDLDEAAAATLKRYPSQDDRDAVALSIVARIIKFLAEE